MQKLTFGQLAEIALLAYSMLKQGKGLREGQAVFNAAYKLFPKQASELRGTEADPFYVSKKIPEFLKALADDDAKAWVDELIEEVYL